MRDLSKTKLHASWKTKPMGLQRQEITLLQIRVGARGAFYTCFPVLIPGLSKEQWEAPFHHVLLAAYKLNLLSWRDARDMRLPQLSFWAKGVGDLLTEGLIDQTVAEKVLDFLYEHLNQRLNT